MITDAGHPPSPRRRTCPDRVVLTATLGEPLVKVIAFGHGVAARPVAGVAQPDPLRDAPGGQARPQAAAPGDEATRSASAGVRARATAARTRRADAA